MRSAFGFLLLLASACDSLPAVPSGVCGNLVVEANEQCDGATRCGTTGPSACRFTCERSTRACPGELSCSVDGVCVASAGAFVPFEVAPRYELPGDRLVVGDLDGDGRDDLITVGASLRVRFGAPSEPLRDSYEKQIRAPTGAAAFGQLDGRPGLDVVFPTAEGIFTLVARGRELDALPYASAQALPDDRARACPPTPGWAACQKIDLDHDGIVDRVGYVADRDNLELELARASGVPVKVTLDTTDVITDLTTGDFDGDLFGDIAFVTRPVDASSIGAVYVVYGAPQREAFVTTQLLAAAGITGVAAADLDSPRDGLDDLAVARSQAGATKVAVYLGDSARDLSAPFQLKDIDRTQRDVPYSVVAGEFVGGKGSGIDVMAYARNPAQLDRTYLWWLRGLGGAQLDIGAVDAVHSSQLTFLGSGWKVGDLVLDVATDANGPDEVLALSPKVSACAGPALTAAVPSSRFTGSQLLRSACLGVTGPGWEPTSIGLLEEPAARRAVAIARRGPQWWIGEAPRLDDATSTGQLGGTLLDLEAGCRDPQLWTQTPAAGTFVSWVCDDAAAAALVKIRLQDGVRTTTPLQPVPRGATHVSGDFNGDGLTDLAIRTGREVTVLLQCSTEMAGVTPGC
jgi:hypothetical protein